MKLALFGAIIFAATFFLNPLYPIFAEESNASRSGTALERARTRQEELKKTEKVKLSEKLRVEDKSKMASRAAEFKNKLAAFKDQKKAQATERISDNLNRINQKRMEQMLKRLDGMTTILTKVEARASTASLNPEALASSSAAITTAKSAIEEAKTAVTSQGAKDYTVTVKTESTVKSDAKSAAATLQEDWKTTEKLVIIAKQAVADAIRVTVKSRKGESSGTE